MVRRAVLLGLAVATLSVSCGGEPVRAPDAPSPVADPLAPPGEVHAPAPAVPSFTGPIGARPLARHLEIFRRPGAPWPDYVLVAANPSGDLVPMLVREARPQGWLEIVLPLKPNGVTGWVRASDVEVVEHRERIVVDLSRRVLRHYVDGRVAHRFSVGVGRPGAPTPTGRFYVWVKVRQRDPQGPYGALAIGLSGFSEVLDWWPGGGRVAIHGTVDPSDRGARVSSGCVRVFNPQLRKLRGVPLGTPVVIRR